jgi:hypothetical protein
VTTKTGRYQNVLSSKRLFSSLSMTTKSGRSQIVLDAMKIYYSLSMTTKTGRYRNVLDAKRDTEMLMVLQEDFFSIYENKNWEIQ